MTETFLTEKQLCERLHVSNRTTARWRLTGEGPVWTRLGERRIGYPESGIAAWTATRTHASIAAERAAEHERALA